MANVNYNDEIFATLIQQGKVIASVKVSGVDSIELLIKQIRTLASKCVGLVSVKIRNFSQGWSLCRNIMFDSRRIKAVKPVQLSLF